MNDQAALLAQRKTSWSNYWASGALHSCIGSFEGNYAGEVVEAWLSVLAALPEGARVLDIASGNGALPKLFIEQAPAGKLASVTGVDLAQIRPDWVAKLSPEAKARVSFQGGIKAESLPFEDDGFDLVTSQFGIEYTELPRSLAEAARVLKAGGTLALVLHDPQSLMCRNAREEREHLAWIGRSGMLELSSRMCGMMARAATPAGRQALAADPAAEELRNQLNNGMANMALYAKQASVPDILGHAQRTMFEAIQSSQHSGDAEVGLKQLAWLREQLAQSDLRLAELLDCALDESALDGFLAGTGLVEESRRSLSFPGGERLGWWLQARKPA